MHVTTREEKEVSLYHFGQYLSALMEKHSVSNKELADSIPLDPAQITRMRKGQQGASMETLIAIAHFFKIRPGILLDVYDERPLEEIKDQEALDVAERIVNLSTRARQHIENQLELLSLIRFDQQALATDEVTPEQVKQAEATLNRYRLQLRLERAETERREKEGKDKNKDTETWQPPDSEDDEKEN